MKDLPGTDTITIKEPKGIKSFLKYAIEREGKEYNDEAADKYINSYNGDNNQLINDVAARAGVPETELESFRERAYREFELSDKSASQRIEKVLKQSPKVIKDKNIDLNSPLVAGTPKMPANEDQSFLGKLGKTAWNELNVGGSQLGSWMADVPGLIYDLAGAPFRAVGMKVPKSEDFEDGALEQVSDYYKQNAKAFEQKVDKINPDREQGIVDSYTNGDFQQGTLNLVGSISESLPASIAMIITGGSTLPTILGSAGVFGAAKVQELDENAPEMDYDKRRIIGVVNGTLEGVFETLLGSGAVGRSLSEIIKQSGKKEAKEQIKRSVSTMFSDMITKNPWLAPLGEGFEEVGTQISQNMVDKYSGYRPDISITEGVGDAFAAGVTMGAVHGSVIGLAKKAVANKQQSNTEQLPGEPATGTPGPVNPNGTITTAEIEGQKYTILNPEDLGHKKPVFAKNEKGERKFFQWTKVNNETISTEPIRPEINNEGNGPVLGISSQDPATSDPNPKISPRNQEPFELIRSETKIEPAEQPKADVESPSTNEVDMNSLSPEERFKTLIKDDEQIAKEMLQFDIEELKKELTELQKQNPDKPSTKFARLKRLKEVNKQLKELPKLLNLKAKDFETNDVPLQNDENRPRKSESPDVENLPNNREGNRGNRTGSIQANQEQREAENAWNKLINDESKKSSTSINQDAYHPETVSLIGKINADEALASKRLKELKEDEKQAIVFERDEIRKQISAFKEGVRLGQKDTKERIKAIQSAIIQYAQRNMPYDEVGKRDMFAVINKIRDAQTPGTIEKAFDKIDEITKENESNKNIRAVERLIKWMTNFRQKGQNKEGKFTYETVKEFEKFKRIHKEAIAIGAVKNNNRSTAKQKAEADKALEAMWQEIDQKENKSLLDITTMKLIELRRNGRAASKELIQAIREDLQEIYDAAKDSKTAEDIERVIYRKEDRDFVKQFLDGQPIQDRKRLERWMAGINGFLADTMGNWETILTMMGGYKLRDKFSLIINQVEKEVNTQEAFDKVMETAMNGYKLKDKKALQHKINSMKKKEYSIVKPIREGDRGEGSDIPLSKLMLIDIYNAIQNEEIRDDMYLSYGDIVTNPDDGRPNEILQRRIGKERIDKLMENLDEGDIIFAKAMQQSADSYYSKINDVFIRTFNRDLPKRDNYWPSTAEFHNENDAFNQMLNDSLHPSATKERATRRTPKITDAFEKFAKHIKNAEWYANMALPVTRLNNIFKDPNVKDLITEQYGDNFYRLITEHLQEQGLYPKSKASSLNMAEKGADWLLNNWVAASIGLTPSVPVKQLLSVINYSENMPVGTWTAGFIKAMANPAKTWKEMMEIPYLKTRLGTGYSEAVQHALNSNEGVKQITSIHQAIKELATIGTRYGDIAAISFGGKPYLDYLLSTGMDEKEAVDKFLLDTLRSQQSPFSSTLSKFQNRKTPLTRAVFAFSNTPSQYMRKMVESVHAYKKGDITKGQLAKVLTIYGVLNNVSYVVVGALMGSLLSGNDWDEDLMKKLIIQTSTSVVGGIPFVKDVVELLANTATDSYVFDDMNPILEGPSETIKAINKAARTDDPEKAKKQMWIATKYFMQMFGISGRNLEKIFKATVKRGDLNDKVNERKADEKLKELSTPKTKIDAELKGMSNYYSKTRKNKPDYKVAETAHQLKYAYSGAKSKATQLEGEGKKAQADRLRDSIKQSKVELSHSDYSYETLKEELDYVERMTELLTK
ncbi:hypothetical protein [Draconibacterium mangrovi]|uniref:hypothetical protein n=1 Tax=Draconibacterium mangrovi TaxID=2697469 RepID=UPI0013D13EC1|nr:hypothetical protein [Draconibacterium mangrovi]